MIRCILALGLFSSALGRHLQEGNDLSRVGRLPGDAEERQSLERRELSRRSAGLNEQACTALSEVESALENSTNTVSDCKSAGVGLLSQNELEDTIKQLQKSRKKTGFKLYQACKLFG